MEEPSTWNTKRITLKQAGAAEKLTVSRPRVSDVVNKKAAKFRKLAIGCGAEQLTASINCRTSGGTRLSNPLPPAADRASEDRVSG